MPRPQRVERAQPPKEPIVLTFKIESSFRRSTTTSAF